MICLRLKRGYNGTNNFQRPGALSNAQVGSEFEELVREHFASQGLSLVRGFKVPVGVGQTKKLRKFDWGSDEHAILIECKSHAWTGGRKHTKREDDCVERGDVLPSILLSKTIAKCCSR